jgi:hypothetical protein
MTIRSVSLLAKRLTTLTVILALLAAPERAGAVGVDPGKATPVQREQAQARFVRGKQLYDAKRFDEALVEFRAAMDIVASPNARLYVARCLREQGKLVEAYVEFGRTAVEANEHAREDTRYARTGGSAAVERDALGSRLAFITVHVDHASEATTLTIAGDQIKRAAWAEPAPVMPGAADVVVETPGGTPIRQSLTLTAGYKKDLFIDATAGAPLPAASASASASTSEPFDKQKLRTFAYVAGGVGAAGVVTFAVAGLLSNGAYSDLKSQCSGNTCPPSASSEISRGRTEQTIANVGLVIGLVGLAAGVTLFVVSMPPKSQSPTVGTAIVVGPGWSGVTGVF